MVSSSEYFDVAIVGAGPAGSSTAIRLALAGFRVVLVEQKAFPRDKLCGEFISPECLTHFAELGVLEDLKAAGGTDLSETVFYSRGGKSVSVDSSWFGEAGSVALGLSRAETDARLLGRAREVGVEVRAQTTACKPVVTNSTVSGIIVKDAASVETAIAAGITIDATGRSRSLSRRFGVATWKTSAKFVAFKTYLRGVKLAPAACEIYVYSGGYGGCNPVEDDLFNLCFIVSSELAKRAGSRPERLMRDVVCTNSRAAEVLSDANVVNEWFAVPITRYGRGEPTPTEGLIAVGDAAAFIDPFTGSGILLALQSGRIAAEAIAVSSLTGLRPSVIANEYSTRYGAAFNRRLRVCSILRHAAFLPAAAGPLIAGLAISSRLRQRIARATRAEGG